MASAPGMHLGPCTVHFWRRVIVERRSWFVLVGAVLLASLAWAQGSPRVSGVEPASGKVNDSVTVAGENLGKSNVSAVFLSDDKTDYKATVVEQADGKIVIKVPQVKAGNYKVSLQVGINIYIQPVRFTVEN
jgi:IPT/TIG domain